MKTLKEKAIEYSKICKFCEEEQFSPRCDSCEFRGRYQGFVSGYDAAIEKLKVVLGEVVLSRNKTLLAERILKAMDE